MKVRIGRLLPQSSHGVVGKAQVLHRLCTASLSDKENNNQEDIKTLLSWFMWPMEGSRLPGGFKRRFTFMLRL